MMARAMQAEDVMIVTAPRADKAPHPDSSAATSTDRRLRATHLRIMFARLTKIGFPRRFPIVQFPNAPLIVALVAGQIAQTVRGATHPYLVSIAYLAMTVWAYEELAHGVNWFRRLLGFGFAIILIVRVARAVRT
jgi:hypothetical protein